MTKNYTIGRYLKAKTFRLLAKSCFFGRGMRHEESAKFDNFSDFRFRCNIVIGKTVLNL